MVNANDSILVTTKKLLGISEDDPSFDADVVASINFSLLSLSQLGVGPKTPFAIMDESSKWGDFVTGEGLDSVVSYIWLRSRLVFDPPTSGYVTNAIKDEINELVFRLNILVDDNSLVYSDEQSE